MNPGPTAITVLTVSITVNQINHSYQLKLHQTFPIKPQDLFRNQLPLHPEKNAPPADRGPIPRNPATQGTSAVHPFAIGSLSRVKDPVGT